MESRLFIKTAALLTTRIKDFALVTGISESDDWAEGEAIQKQLNNTFAGLQNPTLPSAAKLVKTAVDNGFNVDPRTLHAVHAAEAAWRSY